MIRTAIKKRINNKEWMQHVFVELVSDVIMIVLGIIFVYVFRTYIA